MSRSVNPRFFDGGLPDLISGVRESTEHLEPVLQIHAPFRTEVVLVEEREIGDPVPYVLFDARLWKTIEVRKSGQKETCASAEVRCKASTENFGVIHATSETTEVHVAYDGRDDQLRSRAFLLDVPSFSPAACGPDRNPVAGFGYRTPSNSINATPGQVMTVSVFGVPTRIPNPVFPVAMNGLPTDVQGLSVTFVQGPISIPLPIRGVQQCPPTGVCSPPTTFTLRSPSN